MNTANSISRFVLFFLHSSPCDQIKTTKKKSSPSPHLFDLCRDISMIKGSLSRTTPLSISTFWSRTILVRTSIIPPSPPRVFEAAGWLAGCRPQESRVINNRDPAKGVWPLLTGLQYAGPVDKAELPSRLLLPFQLPLLVVSILRGSWKCVVCIRIREILSWFNDKGKNYCVWTFENLASLQRIIKTSKTLGVGIKRGQVRTIMINYNFLSIKYVHVSIDWSKVFQAKGNVAWNYFDNIHIYGCSNIFETPCTYSNI